MKRTCLTLIATMIVLLGLFSSAYAAPLTYSLGDTLQDFTFVTYDGQEMRFSDVLQEKEAVLINIWASWCGPCRSEFPYMQQAYEKYQDKVEVIALSSEATDTPETLAKFAKEYGLTFKIGQDPVDFLSALQIGSIPTTLMVDRFGTICLIETGAQPSVENFERMFEAFLGDEYTESVLYRGIPAAKPNVAAVSEEELATALEVDAFNPASTRVWPMIPCEKDGRSTLTSSNAAQASSEAAVSAVVTAKAGDAIVVTFKTSTESVFDLFKITVNDKVHKVFSGVHEWMDYAIPVDADGEYTIKLSYVKDDQGDAYEDAVWIDRVAIAEDAEAALRNNPVYPPAADESSVYVQNAAAREITIEDASGLLKANFGDARYFITNSDQVNVSAQLGEGYDPEGGLLYTSHGELYPLMACVAKDGYTIEVEVDSAKTTGYACTSVRLYPDGVSMESVSALLFRDEENVELLCQYNDLGAWSYLEEDVQAAMPDALPAQVEYIVQCKDQAGQPVAGAMIQVCDATTCQVLVTDENGQCSLMAAPFAWEIHILMAPQGYTADENTVQIAPVEGGTIVFNLIKQ